MSSLGCSDCRGTKKDAAGNPCKCVTKSVDKPDLIKRFGDFDLKK